MVTVTELAQQIRDEIERSTKALRHIADMIEALDVASPAIMIDIPYRSQHDQDAQLTRADCGPACVAMLLEWRGIGATVDSITRRTSMGATNAGQLMAVAAYHGLKLQRFNNMEMADLERWLQMGKPLIALIKYSELGSGRQDLNYPGLHWLVVVGFDAGNIYVNDPDYWGDRRAEGHARPMSRVVFSTAWGTTLPDAINRQALVVVDATQG